MINKQKVQELYNALPEDVKFEVGTAEMFESSINDNEQSRIGVFNHLNEKGISYGKLDDYYKEQPPVGKSKAKVDSGSASASAQSKSSSVSQSADNTPYNRVTRGNRQLKVNRPSVSTLNNNVKLKGALPVQEKADNITTPQKQRGVVVNKELTQKATKRRVETANKTGLTKAINSNGGSIVPIVLEEDVNKQGVVEATDVEEVVSRAAEPLTLTDDLIRQGNFKIPEKEVLLQLKNTTGRSEFNKEEIDDMNYEMNKPRVIDFVNSKKEEDPEYKVPSPKLDDVKVDRDDLTVQKEMALMKIYDETGNTNPTEDEIETKRLELEKQALDQYIYNKEGFFQDANKVSAKLLQESIHNPESKEYDETGLLGEIKSINKPELKGNLFKYGFDNDNPKLVNLKDIKGVDSTDFALFLQNSGLEKEYEQNMSQVKNQDDQFNILKKYIDYKTSQSLNKYRLSLVKEKKAIINDDVDAAIAYGKAKIKALDETKYNTVSLTMDVMEQLPAFKKQYDEELVLHNAREKAKHNISTGDYTFKDLTIAGAGLLGDSAGKVMKLTSGTASGLFELTGFLGGELLDFLGETVGVKNDGEVFRKFMKGAADHTDNYYTKQLFNTDRFATGVFTDNEIIHYKGKEYKIAENGLMYDKDMNYIEDSAEIIENGKKVRTDTDFSLHSAISETVSQLALQYGAAKAGQLSMNLKNSLIGQDIVYVLSSLKDNYNTIAESYPEATEQERMAYALPLSMIDSAFERIMPDYKFLEFNPTRAIIQTIKNKGENLTGNAIWNAANSFFIANVKEQIEEHGVSVASDAWNRLTNLAFDANRLKTGISENEVLTTTAITFLATGAMGAKNTVNTFNASRIDLQNALVFAVRDSETSKELKNLIHDPKFEQLAGKEYVETLKAAVFEMEKQTANLPKDLSIKATIESLPLIEKRNELQQKKKDTDPAFNAPIDEQIKSINKQLGELYAKDLSDGKNTNNETNRQGQRGPQIEGQTTRGDGNNEAIQTENPSQETVNAVVTEISNKMMETGLAEGFTMQTQEEFTSKLEELGKNDESSDIKAFVHEGQIYFNQDKVTPETAIHEFGHLWTDLTKSENQETYNKGVELIQSEGSVYLEEAKKDNPELEGDALIEEALVRAIADNGGKIVDKSKKEKITEWLNNLWNDIAFTLGIKGKTAMEIQSMSLQEFAESVSSDLLRGVKLTDTSVKSPEVKFSKSNKGPVDYHKMVTSNSRFDKSSTNSDVISKIVADIEAYAVNDSKTEKQIEKRIDEALAKHNKEVRAVKLAQNKKKLRTENKKNSKLLDLLKIDTKYLSHKTALEYESYLNDLAKMSKDKLNRENTLNDELISKFKQRAQNGRVNQHIENAIKEGGNRLAEAHKAATNLVYEYMDYLNSDTAVKLRPKLSPRQVKGIATTILKYNKNNDKTEMQVREKMEALVASSLHARNKEAIAKFKKSIRSQLKSDTTLKIQGLDEVKEALRVDTSAFNYEELAKYARILKEVNDGFKNYSDKTGDHNKTLNFTSDYLIMGKPIFDYLKDIEKKANRRRFRAGLIKQASTDSYFTKEELKLMNTPNKELSVEEQLEKKALKEFELEKREQLNEKIGEITDEEIDILLEDKESKLTQEEYEKRKELAKNHRESIINYAKQALNLIEASGDPEIQFIKDLNFDNMMTNDLLLVNKLINNYLTNGDTTAIQRFKEIANAEKAAGEILAMGEMSGVHELSNVKTTWIRNFYRTSLTLNNFLYNITGDHKRAAKLYSLLGFADLSAANTRVKKRDALFNQGYADAIKRAAKLDTRGVDLTTRRENIRRAVIGTLLQAKYTNTDGMSGVKLFKENKNNDFEFKRQIEKYVDATIESYKAGGDVKQGATSNREIVNILEDFKAEIASVNNKKEFVEYLKQNDAGNWEIVNYTMQQFLGISEEFEKVSTELHNTRPKIYSESDYYLPLRKRNLGNPHFSKTNNALINEQAAQMRSLNSESSHNIDRQANARLHKGEAIDLDFDTGMVEAFNSQIYDIESSPVITRMSYLLSNPEVNKKLGSHSHQIQERAAFKILSDRGDLVTKEDFVSKVLKPIERRLRTLGAVAALGGITQPIKQGLPVVFSAYVRQALMETKGFNPLSLTQSLVQNAITLGDYSTRFLANNAKDIPLLQQSSIFYRDDMNVHYGWASDRKTGSSISGVNRSKTGRAVSKVFGENDSLIDTTQKILMTPLRKGDAWAANATFMMYYASKLRDHGLTIEDWKTEHLKLDDKRTGALRKEALDYAQHMINSTQLSSDFTESNMLFNNQSLAAKVVGNVFFSFQRMANNSKSRLGVSATNIAHGENVKENLIEMTSTVAEMAVFQATKQFLLAPLWIAGMALVKGAFFDDDEETKGFFDSYIDEFFKYAHQQKFLSSMAADISPIPEGQTMDFANYLLYSVERSRNKLPKEMTYEAYIKYVKDNNKKKGNENMFLFYNYDKPEKEWYDYIGLYGIPFSNLKEAADASKPFLHEQVNENSSYGGVTTYDYSKVNKTVLGMHALINVMAAGSMFDVDVLRQERKLFREEIKDKAKGKTVTLSSSTEKKKERKFGSSFGKKSSKKRRFGKKLGE